MARDTPARIARADAELLAARLSRRPRFRPRGYDELGLARSIALRSVCGHHMLPFVGSAQVGYLPGERILDLSKLARPVGDFAAKHQVQEQLTKQVADWLQEPCVPPASAS
jgi:GTP cyclohydrolase IA